MNCPTMLSVEARTVRSPRMDGPRSGRKNDSFSAYVRTVHDGVKSCLLLIRPRSRLPGDTPLMGRIDHRVCLNPIIYIRKMPGTVTSRFSS
jgi:hypothetical protein